MRVEIPHSRGRKAPWLTLRIRGLSFRIDRRVPPVLTLALLAMVTAMVINIGVGAYPIPPLDVIRTVLGLPTGNEDYSFIVNVLRLPRMLVAALVGLALGVSGAIIQGLTRNPLADPGILGISAGASLSAVTLIVVVRNVPSGVIPIAAFGGAVTVALLIYFLAWRGGDSPIRLVLVGIGLGAICGAATTLMITFGDIWDVQRALVWITGSVYGRSWEEFWPLLPWIVIFVPLALFLARDLNALNLGEEVAQGLGIPVVWQRGLLLLTAVALAAATVAAAGTIGFVGLMAPHIGRRLVGPDHSGLLPTAGVVGALLVVLADLVGRTLFSPIELPAGLVTAAIGAPFFIGLLWRQQKR
ncbi:FecCD family ABC transporter permease [Chloroflexus aurantiacus]|nr:MAG: iron ABC transporter permease [Armatimonadota bacterium]